MKLLAVGDQHLGARADIGNKPGDRLAEQEAVWEWTLAQARTHNVDAILHAGDVFEHRKPDPETLLAFERPLVKHRNLDGPSVLLIAGNHDLSSLDSGCALDVFAEAGLVELARTPRVALVDGGCLVACLPWAPTSRLTASTNGADRGQVNEVAAQLLADVAQQLYLNALEQRATGHGSNDAPVVLLTHFSISGTALPSGLDVGQLREPVLSKDDLLAIGFDFIVAGHIHLPQQIAERAIYVGSPQPLNFGEADGTPRGAALVTFEESGWAELEHLPAPSRRFITFDVDAEERRALGSVAGDDSVLDAYVRVRVQGGERDVAAFDANALRESLLEQGAYRVFTELRPEREARARDASVDDTLGEDEAFARWLASQNGAVPAELAARVVERAQGYFERVRA